MRAHAEERGALQRVHHALAGAVGHPEAVEEGAADDGHHWALVGQEVGGEGRGEGVQMDAWGEEEGEGGEEGEWGRGGEPKLSTRKQ